VSDQAIKLGLCAPERDLVEVLVTKVVIPGEAGVFEVRRDHTPLLTTLKTGVVAAKGTDGREYHFAVTGGFAEILDNHVTILGRTLEDADQIDLERAKAARERAEQRLTKPGEDIDPARAEASLERAIARLQAQARQGY